jgi:transcription antitermination factor NusG
MLNNCKPQPNWYALQVRTKFATVAAITLASKGYDIFLPTYVQEHRLQPIPKGRTRELPLFPGYLFCRFDVNERFMPILTTPGVMSILCAGSTPLSIPEHEITAIQTMVHSGLQPKPWPDLPIGTRVLIEKGPLAGVEGTALRVDNCYKLVVSVALLQRSIAVEISRDWARPIEAEPTRRGPALVPFMTRAAIA